MDQAGKAQSGNTPKLSGHDAMRLYKIPVVRKKEVKKNGRRRQRKWSKSDASIQQKVESLQKDQAKIELKRAEQRRRFVMKERAKGQPVNGKSGYDRLLELAAKNVKNSCCQNTKKVKPQKSKK